MNGEDFLKHKYLWLVVHNVPLFNFITKSYFQNPLVCNTTVRQKNPTLLPALFFLFLGFLEVGILYPVPSFSIFGSGYGFFPPRRALCDVEKEALD